MSLPSRSAGSITASFIGRVMRPLGGRSSTSIHFQSHSLWQHSQANREHAGAELQAGLGAAGNAAHSLDVAPRLKWLLALTHPLSLPGLTQSIRLNEAPLFGSSGV
jgi:hypothetical protein